MLGYVCLHAPVVLGREDIAQPARVVVDVIGGMAFVPVDAAREQQSVLFVAELQQSVPVLVVGFGDECREARGRKEIFILHQEESSQEVVGSERAFAGRIRRAGTLPGLVPVASGCILFLGSVQRQGAVDGCRVRSGIVSRQLSGRGFQCGCVVQAVGPLVREGGEPGPPGAAVAVVFVQGDQRAVSGGDAGIDLLVEVAQSIVIVGAVQPGRTCGLGERTGTDVAPAGGRCLFHNFIANTLSAITTYCFSEKEFAIEVKFINDG